MKELWNNLRGESPWVQWVVFGLLGLVVLAVIIGSASGGDGDSPAGGSPGELTRSEYGKKWPLAVDHGTVRCEGSGGVGEVIFTDPNGIEYGVNGLASNDYTPIDSIWRSEPGLEKYGLKVSMDPIINAGLKLCG